MFSVTRRTVRNGVVGAVLGVVPLVLLVAPLVGGGVAGYLEGDDARGGGIAGGVAGALMAVFSAAVTAIILAVRFGDLPLSFVDGPVARLGAAAALSLFGAVGQVLVASVGGALGGILEATRRRPDRPDRAGDVATTGRPAVAVVGSLLAGVATFAVVAVAVTAVLDPLVWPSALVGLPVGAVAGAAVTVVGYAFLRRRPGTGAHWRAVGTGAVGVAVVFALLLGGLWVLGQDQVTRSTQSTYEYEVTIDANGTLTEPTIYVPAPLEADSARLAEVFVADARYDRYVPGADPADQPAAVNFSYDLVDTEHGPMVAISADRIEVSRYYYRVVENETMGWTEPIPPDEYDPDDPSMGVGDDGSITFTVTLSADESVDTAEPFGDEPLLAPQYDRTETACGSQYVDTQRCYTYDSRVYADYGADDGTAVSISVAAYGRNEWFSGGWSGNEYRDRATVELLGPQSGWYLAVGELEVGSGRYRN